MHRRGQARIRLHLSKPWEMGEALAWRDLPASVGRRDGDRWFVELERPFRYRDAEYRYFLVAPRLEGWHLSDAASLEVPCEMTPLNGTPRSFDDGDEIVGSVTDYAD